MARSQAGAATGRHQTARNESCTEGLTASGSADMKHWVIVGVAAEFRDVQAYRDGGEA
jgi:hypothetical protein